MPGLQLVVLAAVLAAAVRGSPAILGSGAADGLPPNRPTGDILDHDPAFLATALALVGHALSEQLAAESTQAPETTPPQQTEATNAAIAGDGLSLAANLVAALGETAFPEQQPIGQGLAFTMQIEHDSPTPSLSSSPTNDHQGIQSVVHSGVTRRSAWSGNAALRPPPSHSGVGSVSCPDLGSASQPPANVQQNRRPRSEWEMTRRSSDWWSCGPRDRSGLWSANLSEGRQPPPWSAAGRRDTIHVSNPHLSRRDLRKMSDLTGGERDARCLRRLSTRSSRSPRPSVDERGRSPPAVALPAPAPAVTEAPSDAGPSGCSAGLAVVAVVELNELEPRAGPPACPCVCPRRTTHHQQRLRVAVRDHADEGPAAVQGVGLMVACERLSRCWPLAQPNQGFFRQLVEMDGQRRESPAPAEVPTEKQSARAAAKRAWY
ncbi:hypothetical protein FJT64_011979 [Amphibalanus amphitrite]|uniref:Uncharacterized protein n=1 Tax=Amphibalanus amphitrite TaxID=1232801 RepID=A0A6A4V5D2_AMPAM|nr:hypothetical protein FJT64_011979 [Amphibalanus amphitrite]